MIGNPQVLELLEEILDSRKSPEDVCRDHPELLPEVQRRWQQFCYVDAQVRELLPEVGAVPTLKVAAIGDPNGLPQIPGYLVEAVLGHGGMGVVFKARHLRLNRVVALKMALSGAFAGWQERERFQREIEAVAALRHPNVVQIHDVGDSDGRSYFTMEYVEGGNLAQKLDGTPQPARNSTMLVATLARAAHAAHMSGIVHRDLKPGNVLLTSEGAPKITDFGLARKMSGEAHLTRTGAAVGTPSYMAPEQARGQSTDVGPATDVYALGAILYELLTGRPPFRAATHAETVLQVISQDPIPPSRLNGKVPRDLETICLKCLRKDAQSRYATAGGLADDLDHFYCGEAIEARPEGKLGRWMRQIRRRPALSSAVAISVLLSMILLSGGLWLISDRAATVRAAEGDLEEMARWLRKSSWPKALAARDRAKERLRNGGPDRQRRLIKQGTCDLDMASQLDVIRLEGAGTVGGVNRIAKCDERYAEVFRQAGLGTPFEAADPVVESIKASNIRNALIASLDHWSVCTDVPSQKKWILDVARKSDPDQTGWRNRARDLNVRENQAELLQLIRTAPIKDAPVSLLLALETSLDGKNVVQRVEYLKEIQQVYPDDFWANSRLGFVLGQFKKSAEAIGFFQAALAIRPESSMIHNNLGRVLGDVGRQDEAIAHFRRASGLDPNADLFQVNLARALGNRDQHQEAVDRLEGVLRLHPDSAMVHSALGNCLEHWGQHEKALAAYRKVVELEPTRTDYRKDLRQILMRQRKLSEACHEWKEELVSDPVEHDAWYGYAELCLFLGDVDEYHRSRKFLLDKFGATTDPQIAERAARTCLLIPLSDSELRQSVSLADVTQFVDRAKYRNIFPAFEFVKGLADYREGKFDKTIAAMKGDASRVLNVAPRLVLIMALHKKGESHNLKQQLIAAILSYDWSPRNVSNQDGCICHVLRREAENLIFPNLPQFLDGEYQPQNNDERLAFVGVCQSLNRSASAAQLFADAFAADPTLAANFRDGFRYQAARHATQASSGHSSDVVELNQQDRVQWRARAREWFQADLDAWRTALDADSSVAKELQQRLREWQTNPDLACVRDTAELEKLVADEREEWLAFWEAVGVLLTQFQK